VFEKLKKQLGRGKLTPKNITAIIVFGVIVLVFVLFGYQGRHNAVGIGSAARVNSTLISVADFRNESQRMEQMYGQIFGAAGGGDAQRQFIRMQALDNLITTELIAQGAKDQGVIITDAEVRDYILNEMPVFKRDGRFQREVYLQVLQANRMTPGEFEEKIRRDIKNQRTRRLFEAAIQPLDLEVQKLKALRENKIDISFVKLDEQAMLGKVEVSDSEVASKIKDPAFAKKIEAEFAANKSAYAEEEQVRASHLLIKADKSKANGEKAAFDKINELKKRAASEDFAKLASQYSQDTGSQAKKGDLGYFSRGRMLPEFEQAAFNQKVGIVGEPVRTAFGYHLIKVTDHRPEIRPDLEQAKMKIAQKILAQEKMDAMIQSLEEALKKGDQAQVDAQVKKLGGSWEQTGYADMNAEVIPKIGSRLATQAAFDLNEKTPLLPRLVRDGGNKYVLRFKGMKKEEVKDDTSWLAQVTRERTYETFALWIEQMRKSSTIEKNPSVIAQ
jgi:parvulin-like peptidyl-prolyl isomerase